MFGASQKNSLKKLGDYLRVHNHQDIQIEGHVFSSGSIEKDLEEGENIAKFAEHFLEGQGVNSHQMTVISYGSEKPGTEDAREKSNLRLVVVYLCDHDCGGGDVIED
jgi:outer membrane protein OmpA-like peptidoglycan-associated protein